VGYKGQGAFVVGNCPGVVAFGLVGGAAPIQVMKGLAARPP
jgi:hypothetical protein